MPVGHAMWMWPPRQLRVLAACLAVACCGPAAPSATVNGTEEISAVDSEANLFERLYWTRDFDAGGSAPLRKRWSKVMRQHSGLQLVEVMEDRSRNSFSLYLDRALQLTDTGEHMYHEMMAHVPLMTQAKPPQDVLIMGGGDGGVTLRVLRHASVQRVVQVELDEMVVNASKEFFPQLAAAYDDPRVQLRIEDAIAWAQREAASRPAAFDVCIIDSTDQPLASIWTAAFFASLRALLRPGGLLMQNAQSLDVPTQLGHLLGLHREGGFDIVRPVLMTTVDYGSPYVAFLSSSAELGYDCQKGPAVESEARFAALETVWYSPGIHRGSLQVPPGLQRRFPALAEGRDGCLRQQAQGDGCSGDAGGTCTARARQSAE